MAELLSIKIKIGNREYPMRVHPDDEQRIRKAGKLLHEKLKAYRDRFGLDDMQDLLAMVAFDVMADKLKVEASTGQVTESALLRIQNLNKALDETLSTSDI